MSKTLKELDLVIVEVFGLELEVDHLVYYGNDTPEEELIRFVRSKYGDVEVIEILR